MSDKSELLIRYLETIEGMNRSIERSLSIMERNSATLEKLSTALLDLEEKEASWKWDYESPFNNLEKEEAEKTIDEIADEIVKAINEANDDKEGPYIQAISFPYDAGFVNPFELMELIEEKLENGNDEMDDEDGFNFELLK